MSARRPATACKPKHRPKSRRNTPHSKIQVSEGNIIRWGMRIGILIFVLAYLLSEIKAHFPNLL